MKYEIRYVKFKNGNWNYLKVINNDIVIIFIKSR